jgi:glycosyltransferase involved in cell wall biosynthesis
MLVSILIPCFNTEKLIGECIGSALAQTWPEKEIIVVDDGSTDRSLDIIREFDGRIRWETGRNRGGNSARNRLLELSKGEWLQYLDADDYLRPDKIRGQVQFASERPDADIICSPTVWEKKCEDGTFFWQESVFPRERDPWIMLALWQLPQTGGSLWRRSALQRVGGWLIGQPCCQEHELYLRLLQAGSPFMFFDECLAVHRIWEHGSRLTTRLSEEVERQRLLILGRMEQFLRDKSELTLERRQAINDARHHMARMIWLRNPTAALDIMRQIEESDASFHPSEGPLSLPAYRLTYKMLGFVGAQWVADSRRKIASIFKHDRIKLSKKSMRRLSGGST